MSMIKDYYKTLPGLEQDIISKIRKLERKGLFIKQSIFGAVALVSFAGIIPSGLYIAKALSTSGLSGYLSLMFSDVGALSYWKELALSILESLPFLGLAIGLGVTGLFLWSLLKTVRIQVMKNAIA